jgi:hypothetical protein
MPIVIVECIKSFYFHFELFAAIGVVMYHKLHFVILLEYEAI